MNQIDEKRVSMVIKRLKNKFSYGLDGISNFLIKNCSEVLSKPLTLIINQTLTSGIFPEKLKSSKVIPIFKSGEVSCISNYRPIYLLPSLSKIFEYDILDQLTTALSSFQRVIEKEDKKGKRPLSKVHIHQLAHFGVPSVIWGCIGSTLLH